MYLLNYQGPETKLLACRNPHTSLAFKCFALNTENATTTIYVQVSVLFPLTLLRIKFIKVSAREQSCQCRVSS